ncbi:hypothetical protein HDU87_002681 [Geranomyces variabilis]|uniref:Uncharacterized protein n=1 Tax=Geranomyces variabilis TaxID=109894 RepID=A0AAD5TS09_9FUNG|nr:hypothetical protein HDU87_002681 [Geranomyces variabilis]
MRLPPLEGQVPVPAVPLRSAVNKSGSARSPSGNTNVRSPKLLPEPPGYAKQPLHKDPVSHAVFVYLRTGVLPSTDIEVPIPGPDTGPGRGMTGCITANHIMEYAKGWYIGNDGELYQRNLGPGAVRYDGPVLNAPPEKTGEGYGAGMGGHWEQACRAVCGLE